MSKQTKNEGSTPHFGLFWHICRILPIENRIFWKNPKKIGRLKI